MKLIPITYHNKKYPSNIISNIDEIAGHLDKTTIKPSRKYSLHTEYSHMKRKLTSNMLEKYPILKESHKGFVPQLWKSKDWAEEFANFIIELIADNEDPEIIEIHPPFDDYCENIEKFLDIYGVFEKIISKKYPKTKIFIENRCGTFYTGGNFLLSTADSIVSFLQILKYKNLKLKIVLDYPQVFSAEKIKLDNIKLDKIEKFNENIKPYINLIGGFHIWGKRKNITDTRWTPHTGNLNTLFSFNDTLKKQFLLSILNTYNDDLQRYFVPEVNSGESDLQSIVSDMQECGFEFPIAEEHETNNLFKQIQAITWHNNIPYLNIYDSKTTKAELIPLIGIKTIKKGLYKRCIGYKNLTTAKHVFCEKHGVVQDKENQCPVCKNMDKFTYCIMCKGENCRNYSQEALQYCAQPHYVYLAYFSKDKIKVGTAYFERKTERLIEQGAPLAFLIAKTPTGKIAREIEHKIVSMGYSESVSSKYKAKNIIIDNDKDKIIDELKNHIEIIKSKLSDEYLRYLIDPEIYDDLDKIKKINEKLYEGGIIQTSLFDTNAYNFEINKVSSPFTENQPIIGVVGNIGFIKDKNKNLYINIKDLIGWEITNIE